ncbi:hypothetical protein OF897_15140 [Chryseobacterium formosus]|uniref:Ig-like domain-containing protein n=1 Tax=Chryseobacterium formosus TaxID=1537363 RepID=A0ABT3XUC5_9FLAO|nr:hypothetical protein [Chryseobacterium formosus]MCX8525254.1 hypothetical protein [Chryseobacterium formosus]
MMKQTKTKSTMKQTRSLFFVLLLFLGNLVLYGQCSVNAGGNAAICGTSYTLQGTTIGTPTGTPTWTIVTKPAGAPDPVFSNPNILTPTVTGMTFPGNYVFQVAQNCSPSGSGTSQVTITSPGATTGFTAGPDITGIPATTGVATLNATIPDGYTPSWRFYNMYDFETFSGAMNPTNAALTSTTTASTTLTLTNTANHTIDPSYRVIVRITSNVNSSCWYEDDAIVRFIPNPNMLWNSINTQCVAPGTTGDGFYIDPISASPKLATTTANSSGTIAAGTTVAMTAISQPPGGNIQYSRISNGRLHFSGITAIGDYVFDLTISNITGSSTTRLTYRFNGTTPSALTFLDAAHPDQTELYSFGNTGGAVYCGMVGTSTPITFYYKINAADPPTIADAISNGTPGPAGGSPTFVQSGAGTANRSVTLTPPSGGWRAGTYKIAITLTAAGGCTRQHTFYAHISDGARPAVNVNNITVCYSGSGVVTATVPLPAVYQTTTYFQEFSGRYDFTLVSSPAGASVTTYQGTASRSFTSTSTIISNLDKAGEYVFKIKATSGSGAQKMIDSEYACSGTSLEDTFSVFVSGQVGANAGSAQSISCITTATLNGNNPGTGGSTGLWTIASKPAGAPDPVITNPAQYNSGVTNLVNTGAYTFDWTITTGTCTSTAQTTINVTAAPSAVTVTPATQTVAYNATPTNLTGSATGATSYQWYSNTANDNTTGTLISGATSTTYTPPTNIAGTRYYYMVATNAACSTPSATVQVNVTPCAGATTAPTVNTFTTTQCPAGTANLNTQAHTGAVPANSTLIWYTDASRTNMVTNPTAVGAGTYYAFYFNSSSNCYSPASSPVNVLAVVCSACTAAIPQQVSLTSITVAAAPTGSVLQWHNSATPSASTLLSSTTVNATSTPTNYWAYYYDSVGNCYSPGSKATVVGNSCCNYPTVDLAALSHSAVPAGTQLVWYSTSGRLPGSQVNNPTAIGSGLYWPFFYDPALNCYSQAGTPVLVGVDSQCNTACYKPGVTTGTTLDTKVGITSLGRAGATDNDNWPMARKGGWIALESKTKGFVPNRVAFSGGNPVGVAPANFVEGMMVYDATNKCLKIYTLKAGDTAMAWHCVTTQTCPD